MENGKWKMENKRRYWNKLFSILFCQFKIIHYLFSIFRFPFSTSHFLLLIILTGGYFSVSAQKKNSLGWVWQNPLPQGNPLYSINFTKDKQTGYAVGADGTILSTTDGGFNWIPQQSPTETVFSSVFVRDKLHTVAVGIRGTVVTTIDGGKKWMVIPTGIKDHLQSVTFTGENLQTG